MTEHTMTEATPLAFEQITQEDRREAMAAALWAANPYAGSESWDSIGMRRYGGTSDTRELFLKLADAALSASPAPSGQGVSGEVRGPANMASATVERIATAVMVWGRPHFKHMVAFSTLCEAIEKALPAPAPSCAPGEVERVFRPMETWDERDEAVLLLIDYDDGDHPLADARFAITIGHNNDHNVGDDEGQGWRFAGWCWSHDHYVEGKGKPVGWMPIPHILARAYAAFDGEPAALSPQRLDAKEGGE